MAHTTVRISDGIHAALKEIAAAEGASLQGILERAVEEYRRRRFLDRVNEGYAALRKDDAEWARVCEERGEWESTLRDGLEGEEVWQETPASPVRKKRKR